MPPQRAPEYICLFLGMSSNLSFLGRSSSANETRSPEHEEAGEATSALSWQGENGDSAQVTLLQSHWKLWNRRTQGDFPPQGTVLGPVMPSWTETIPMDQLRGCGRSNPVRVWGKLPGKPLEPQLNPTAQLTLDASLSNSARRWSINREGSSGLKESNMPWPNKGSAGLFRLAASPGWQRPSSQQQGCTSTCRATAGAHTEDKAPFQGWDPLPGAGFSALIKHKSIQFMERWITLSCPPVCEVTAMSDWPTWLSPSSDRSGTAHAGIRMRSIQLQNPAQHITKCHPPPCGHPSALKINPTVIPEMKVPQES